MFGLTKKDPSSDKLNVRVHVNANAEAFNLATKIWNENLRTLRFDQATRKEFLHFGYANPKCVVWLQRDKGRVDVFELVVRWETDKTYEVFVISDPAPKPTGDATRANALLNSMLTTPSIILSGNN
jgi:hypothetical protein